MVFSRKGIFFMILFILIASSLACNLSRATPAPTPTPISTQEVIALETQVSSAVETAVSGGEVNLEFNEAQLTTLANQALQEQGETRLRDLQVRLDDGLITVTGQANQNGMDLPLSLSIRVNVDAEGQPKAEIVEGKVGPFALPESLLEQFTSQFDVLLKQQLNAAGGNLFVKRILIDDGKILVTAQYK